MDAGVGGGVGGRGLIWGGDEVVDGEGSYVQVWGGGVGDDGLVGDAVFGEEDFQDRLDHLIPLSLPLQLHVHKTNRIRRNRQNQSPISRG